MKSSKKLEKSRNLSLLLLLTSICIAGCSSATLSTVENTDVKKTDILPSVGDSPIIVDVPKTLYKLTMIPVPLENGSSIYMSKHEITWDVFDIYAFSRDLEQSQITAGVDAEARPTRPYGAPDQSWGHQDYAAISMTKYSAIKFTEWLSKSTGRKFRIPTESEWETACSQANSVDLEAVAWHRGNSDFQAHEVGTKAPNDLGIYDMLGNVAEWVITDREGDFALGGSHNMKPNDLSCDSEDQQEPFWNDTDPQIPKSEWWLSDVFYVGIRVVMDP